SIRNLGVDQNGKFVVEVEYAESSSDSPQQKNYVFGDFKSAGSGRTLVSVTSFDNLEGQSRFQKPAQFQGLQAAFRRKDFKAIEASPNPRNYNSNEAQAAANEVRRCQLVAAVLQALTPSMSISLPTQSASANSR